MESNNYDAGSDVEGIFPEEFRKYVRDLNLICRHMQEFNSCWFFGLPTPSDEADRDITKKLANLVDTCITGTGQCLVQFWRAQEVTSIGDFGERRFRLTSCNQPFIFMRRKDDKTPFREGICSYRMKMVDFITGDGGGGGGVIGRVFRNNRMEHAPNIGYYSYEEYSHRDLALSCDIKSSLAVPLSDSSGRSVGVVEMVSSEETNLYAWKPFFRDLVYVPHSNCCKDISEQYDSIKMAVSEIKEVMQLVSPRPVLAKIWMLCNHCSCLSIYNLPGFYIQESSEYNLLSDLFTLKKGEGVVGKAVTSSHNLVYCDDVSQFSITEYPLVHFARHRKLTACFATCLRSNHAGNQIYVLEFFLNPRKVQGRRPRAMLVPILQLMRKKFQTFKLASGEEIGDKLSVQVIDARFQEKCEILKIGKFVELKDVCVSMFKRVRRDYQISSGPPRKKNLDQSHSGNYVQIGVTKEFGGSVSTVQSESLVTIKAKYGDNFIKFKLSASSGINAFNQQVSKRLELEAGSYVVKHQDEDNDWILVKCDDDLRDYISSSALLGKTTLTMLLEHI